MENRCELCRFFKRYQNCSPNVFRCRANPPTTDGFPETYPSEWCGAFKDREQALAAEKEDRHIRTTWRRLHDKDKPE